MHKENRSTESPSSASGKRASNRFSKIERKSEKDIEGDNQSEFEDESKIETKASIMQVKVNDRIKSEGETDDEAKGDGQEEEEDEDITVSSSEEEYEVEKIVGKRVRKGIVEYRVKWVGYSDNENTWQTVDSMSCPELVAKYEAELLVKSPPPPRPPKEPKKKLPNVIKRTTKRKLGGNDTLTTQKTAKPPLKKNDSIENSSSNFSSNEESQHQLLQQQQQQQWEAGDWEDKVDHIDTVTRNENGGLHVWIQWTDGEVTEELANEANVRCPQRVIQFYESRLKFPGEKY